MQFYNDKGAKVYLGAFKVNDEAFPNFFFED